MELFGFKFGKKQEKPAESSVKKSFAIPEGEDGSLNIETAPGGFYASYINFDLTISNDTDLILKYREIAMHPEVESAIEDIISEAIVTEDAVQPVKLVTDKLKYPKEIQNKIAAEFEDILTMLQFNTKGYEIFRRWYIDSRLVYHIIVDENNRKKGINELRFVDPINIKKIREHGKKIHPNNVEIYEPGKEYFIYRKDGFKNFAALEGIKIEPDSISYTTSGLYDSRNKRVIGFLHKAIKAVNQLRMMEDSLLIYRIARAPERRIFYIDVGNLPKQKAEQYVKDLMNRYKNKLVYDVQTGEIKDNSRQMSMLEDFWLPRREGGKGTEISTLKGGENLGSLDDVLFFQKKLYKALNVPSSRLQDEGKSFSIGRGTEISRDEIKFAKFISRMRNKFAELFLNLLKTQLLLKGIIRDEVEWEQDIQPYLFFDFLKDSYFTEIKQQELWTERLNLMNLMQPFQGTYFSQEWIKSTILGFNKREIDTMSKQIEKEKKLGMQLDMAQQMPLPQQVPPFGQPIQPQMMDPSMMMDPNEQPDKPGEEEGVDPLAHTRPQI